MEYFVRRGSEEYGPYTLADLRRFASSGHLGPHDGVRAASENAVHQASMVLGASAWSGLPGLSHPQAPAPHNQAASPGQPNAVPVHAHLPAYQLPQMKNGASLPPNIHWGLVLALSFLTCGMFPYIWVLMQAWWTRQIWPSSRAIWYLGASLGLLYVPMLLVGMLEPFIQTEPGENEFDQPVLIAFFLFFGLTIIAALVLWVLGLFAMRQDMESYFSEAEPTPEPISVDPLWTFLGGMYYLQWHMSRIHRWKTEGFFA